MWFDLQICITVPKTLRSEIQVWLTVSKILWRKRITILSHSVVMFVIWFTIWYHMAENFRGDHEFCRIVLKTLWGETQICIRVAENLKLEIQVCLTRSNKMRCELHVCLRRTKILLRWTSTSFLTVWINLTCEKMFLSKNRKVWDLNYKFFSVSKRLRGELQVCLTVSKFCYQIITNMSPKVEVFVERFKKMHHSAKTFDIWITSLSKSVEIFEKWSEALSHSF